MKNDACLGRIICRQNDFSSRHVLKLFCLQIILPILAVVVLNGCATGKKYWIPRGQQPEIVNMETTGYCKCGKCCGWKRNWKFQPVFSYGPQKGKPKAVGITATGTMADWGTIAADTRRYPFGTIMHIPGYGWGRVEDVGGAIKGEHIDLFFPSHKKALEWGRERKDVKVWKPQS